ncbi:MAG: hypothetical protein V3V17_09990, partial [Alphaproteobacteria bacterium]
LRHETPAEQQTVAASSWVSAFHERGGKLNGIQALYDNPAWPDCPLRSSGIGLMRRLTCLTDLAAAWVTRPYAVGLAGWRNAKSIGRIGRASVAFGRAAARWFDVR